jgi:hypothetical protein
LVIARQLLDVAGQHMLLMLALLHDAAVANRALKA